VAPRRTNVTNVNVNVNRNKVNVGNQVNVGNRNTNVGSGNTNVNRDADRNRNQQQDRNRAQQNVSKGSVDRTPNATNRSTPGTRTPATSNRSTSGTGANKARATERGYTAPGSNQTAKHTAIGGYGNGSQTKAASDRGKSSASKTKGHAKRPA